MTKQAELIKAIISLELEKTGQTLSDFEASLKKSTSMNKTGEGLFFTLDPAHLSQLVSGVANAYGLSAAGVGLGAGALGYQGYKQLADSDDIMAKKQKEKDQYTQALHSLMVARNQNQQV